MQLDTTAAQPRLDAEAHVGSAVIDLVAATDLHTRNLAVSAPDGQLTYGELRERASVIASRLRSLGVVEGDLVGLSVERSAGLIVAALGIREAGAAYVALDPVHPDQRLREMLADCGAAAVVFGAELGPRLALGPAGPACPGGLEMAPLASMRRDQSVPGLAYVVYTSGSTGAPKGVLVGEAGLSNLIDWHRREFRLSPADRCTQVAAPGFDAFAWEVWPCLSAGASLHLPPQHLRTDPVALRDWIVAEEITVSFLPTPLAEAVLALEWPAATSLRLLLTGGDRMHRPPPAGLPFAVVNNYGVSEATVVSTSGVVPAGGNAAAPSIGRPIDGVQIRIVDDNLQPVPDGESGELLIGGVSLAVGYLGRPDLTVQRFVKDPYPATGDDRWYRTGDLVRRLPSGELAFLGRSDDQLKIRGNRVEPGEIGALLERHPAVARAVVKAVHDECGEPALVAYLRSYDASRPADEELRAFAARRLPTVMLPAAFVWLEKFPVTANGKIDMAALPELVDASESAAAPNESERLIAELVADVLDVPVVKPADNFILLGGDSLLAARLMVRIADRFDVELPLRTVFEHPTVVELAAEVRSIASNS